MGLLGTVLSFIERLIRLFIGANEEKLYGLDHAILNVEAPPRSMWMNMGYWKDTKSFPEACEALLELILITARLLNEDKTVASIPSAIKLVDVGIGCGDQSLHLTRKLPITGPGEQRRALIDSYVGVTFARSQADFARKRLLNRTSDSDTSTWTPDVKIFAADAAKPDSWELRLKQTVLNDHDQKQQTWLLALDTLYHYIPSRIPLLTHACRDLQASFMAFDLLLDSSTTFTNRLLVRLMCLLSGIPYTNLLTTTQYEDMLVQAGYDRDFVQMCDISEHVFPGISRFIAEKDGELKKFGMGVGKFKVPGWLFGWWGRSGVIRGVVVVARR